MPSVFANVALDDKRLFYSMQGSGHGDVGEFPGVSTKATGLPRSSAKAKDLAWVNLRRRIRCKSRGRKAKTRLGDGGAGKPETPGMANDK